MKMLYGGMAAGAVLLVGGSAPISLNSVSDERIPTMPRVACVDSQVGRMFQSERGKEGKSHAGTSPDKSVTLGRQDREKPVALF
jgi:hypothetical protein